MISRTFRMGLVLGLIGSLFVTPSAMAGANTRDELLRMWAEAKEKLRNLVTVPAAWQKAQPEP